MVCAIGLIGWLVPCTYGQLSLQDPVSEIKTPEVKYLFPINPGHPGLLAGTMGELRSTHFHAGIDIRTNNMVGVPVLASGKGYVIRAMVSSYSYGKVLFVQHPDGNLTVYAHLDRFKGRLGDFVRNAQYERKSFEIDLSFSPNQFPVLEGDTIALSGNTGGSSGPHLHFEIRDSLNEALNPLNFGFSEIRDTSSPVAQKIALKTLDMHSRINDRFGRFEFYVYRVGNTYTFSAPILAHGRIGVEVLAYDKMDQSGFKCGINHIDLYADSQKVFSQVIDKIDFAAQRGILALMDYKALKTSGARFNKLYVDDATRLEYHEAVAGGQLVIDRKDIPVKIVLQDTYGNSSTVHFLLKTAPVVTQATWLNPITAPYSLETIENTLAVTVKPCPGSTPSSITAFSRQEKIDLAPAYQHVNAAVYLIDLRKMQPDSILTCQGTIRFGNQDIIPSGTEYKYYSDLADVKFQEGTLYDTLYWSVARTEKDGREIFTIGDKNTPLRSGIDVVLKPELKYDSKSAVYKLNGAYTFLGGTWKNGRIAFQTQELGDFGILTDSLPPVIRRLTLNQTAARFRVRDNLSGIASFEALVDSRWLLMNYDYKTGVLLSEKLDASKPLKGNFVLKVVDFAGNEQVFTQTIQ